MIHPTAIIDPRAKFAPDVSVGPYAIIEGPAVIGAGTQLLAHAQVLGHTTLGQRNIIHPNAVIGGTPQDRKFKESEISETIIGDDNIFREGVTVHRGTGANTKTVIGNRCYLMANSHVGHNSRIHDDVTLINSAAVAGHAEVMPRAIIGIACSVHQFCRIGRLAMMSSATGTNLDLPPFVMTMTINRFNQLNLVGMRRAGIPRENINAVRQMFQLVFRSGRLISKAIADLPAEIARVPEVQEVIEFVKTTKRGVARWEPWSGKEDEQD